MNYRALTEQLNSLSIQSVGNMLGIKLPLRGSCRCPFPDHNDKNPSFEVQKFGNRWICYGCGRKGGPIDLIKEYHDVDFITAKKWLASKTLNPNEALPSIKTPNTRIPNKDIQNAKVEIVADAWLYNEVLVHNPIQESGISYLLGREISRETIKYARVGQISKGRQFLENLIHKVGFDRVSAGGLLTKASTRDNYRFVFPDTHLLFPYYENSKLIYLQSRTISDDTKSGKWHNLTGVKRVIYKLTTKGISTKRSIAICEGVPDALSAYEIGYDAWGLIGVSAKLLPEDFKQLRNKDVHILLDWDEAGNMRAKTLRAELTKHGIASIRKVRPFPGIKDLNGYLVSKRRQK